MDARRHLCIVVTGTVAAHVEVLRRSRMRTRSPEGHGDPIASASLYGGLR